MQMREDMQHFENVLKRGRVPAGDQRDALRIRRQRLLSLAREQAFGLQLRAKLLKRQLQRAFAEWIERRDIQLILAAWPVDSDATGSDELGAVHRLELQSHQI